MTKRRDEGREEEMRLFLDSRNKQHHTHVKNGGRWGYLRVLNFYNRSLAIRRKKDILSIILRINAIINWISLLSLSHLHLEQTLS